MCGSCLVPYKGTYQLAYMGVNWTENGESVFQLLSHEIIVSKFSRPSWPLFTRVFILVSLQSMCLTVGETGDYMDESFRPSQNLESFKQ